MQEAARFFFADETGALPQRLDLREVDLLYNDYVRVLFIMYEKLKNTYNTFLSRFLTEKQRSHANLNLEQGRFTHAFFRPDPEIDSSTTASL